jgi:hypothetical protein
MAEVAEMWSEMERCRDTGRGGEGEMMSDTFKNKETQPPTPLQAAAPAPFQFQGHPSPPSSFPTTSPPQSLALLLPTPIPQAPLHLSISRPLPAPPQPPHLRLAAVGCCQEPFGGDECCPTEQPCLLE